MKIHLCFVLIILFACENKSKDTIKKQTKQQTTQKISPKINSPYHQETLKLEPNNVLDFLTWYDTQNKHYQYQINTNLGSFSILLYKETPLHRANFAYLVEKKYFETTYFHRVVKNFVVQAGNSDQSKTSQARANIGKYLLPPEFFNDLKHQFGTISAAREWENNPEKLSDPFEFFIVTAAKGASHLNNEHTVFGKVTQGFDTLKMINNQATDKTEFPIIDIKILSIDILD